MIDGVNFYCSLGHKDAYAAGILHRDISAGNIVIDSAGKGWLIDWDMSKARSELEDTEVPRRATRTVCLLSCVKIFRYSNTFCRVLGNSCQRP
jgi:RIO-like serine/threonine protein kinase